MKKASSFLIALPMLVSVFVATGCRKDNQKPSPARETFPIVYRFINEGDPNAKDVILDDFTFYPNNTVDNRGDSLSNLYWNNRVFQDIGVSDTSIYRMEVPGFAGCEGRLRVMVHVRTAMFSPVYFNKGYAGDGDLATGMTRHRIFALDTVHIRAAADGIITFRWPSDTARSIEILSF